MRSRFGYFFVFLVLSVIFNSSVYCQNEEEMDSPQTYDLVNWIQKSVNNIATAENLQHISEDEIKLINGLPNLVSPLPFARMLRDVLSESESSKCGQDLDYVFANIFSLGGWSMKMLDSYGKPESGIMLGNVRWLGDYDECIGIYAPAKSNQGNASVGNFHGKYCTLQIPLNLGNVPLPLSLAACLPDSCNPKEAQKSNETEVLNSAGPFMNLGSFFGNATITCKSTSRKLTAGAVIIALILAIIIFLAVSGSSITAFEYYTKADAPVESVDESHTSIELPTNGDEKKSVQDVPNTDTKTKITLPDWLEKFKPFLNCFCIFTNGEKLLNTDDSVGQLPCLHGIRFLSMTWIILCHTYISAAQVIKNAFDFAKYIDHWIFQIILNGFFSVDSFFLLSGFLVAHVFFKQADKTNGKIPWLYFYIHRYVRITPVYFMVILIHTFILPYAGSGPLWPDNTADKFCTKNWWWNLLYINNFTPQDEQCFSVAWYLANDMQFYVISPLILYTLWRWPKVGYSVMGAFFSITIITNFVITYEYNLIAGLGNIIEFANDLLGFQNKINEFFNKIYFKPYARIGPYLVGILLAYFLNKRKKGKADKLNRIYLTVGWIVASGLTLTCQFGLYHQRLTPVGASFYNAFSRTIFGFGLAWVIFVCIEGQAKIVNDILSWKPWIPLSRLTFCAYLVHPIVQTVYYNSLRTLILFNHNNMFMLYMGFLVISYAFSLVVSLLFESPVIRLERFVRNKFTSK